MAITTADAVPSAALSDPAAAAANKTTTTRNNSKAQQKQQVGGQRPRPRRPLSAYNIFFQRERAAILAASGVGGGRGGGGRGRGKKGEAKQKNAKRAHHKISFADLARVVSERWKNLPPSERDEFDFLADEERERYRREMAEWDRERVAEAERLMREAEEAEREAGAGAEAVPSASTPASSDEKPAAAAEPTPSSSSQKARPLPSGSESKKRRREKKRSDVDERRSSPPLLISPPKSPVSSPAAVTSNGEQPGKQTGTNVKKSDTPPKISKIDASLPPQRQPTSYDAPLYADGAATAAAAVFANLQGSNVPVPSALYAAAWRQVLPSASEIAAYQQTQQAVQQQAVAQQQQAVAQRRRELQQQQALPLSFDYAAYCPAAALSVAAAMPLPTPPVHPGVERLREALDEDEQDFLVDVFVDSTEASAAA